MPPSQGFSESSKKYMVLSKLCLNTHFINKKAEVQNKGPVAFPDYIAKCLQNSAVVLLVQCSSSTHVAS